MHADHGYHPTDLSSQIIIKECNEAVAQVPLHLLNQLADKRILLTGGTGFFGKWILHAVIALNKQHHLNIQADILSRKPDAFVAAYAYLETCEGLSFIKGDIRDFKMPMQRNYNYIIHGATPTDSRINEEELYSIIVDGTKHILKQINYPAPKVLYISSGAIYGPQPPKISHISEDFKPAPITAYGKGKLAAERLCLNSDIPTTIARCFAFVGPYLPLDAHYAIGNFIRSAIHGEDIIINGDGRPFRSYMYSADLIRWLWTILLNGDDGDIYNVGAEQAIDIKSLAEMTVNIINPKSQIKILKEPDLSIPAPRYVPSTAKAKKRLGLDISIDLDEAIKKTWNWYLDAKIIK